jgi:radical SAM protein with 4Fe4S-binding SPASM domain
MHERGKGYLNLDLARRVIDDAARFGVSQVRFFLAGEPVFHPHLGEMIALARQQGMLTQVHTNATILDEKRSAKLLDSGLDSISFSFDGENAQDYESIRIGADFEKTLENIIRFLRMKKERKLSNPFVIFQVIKPFNPGSPFLPTLDDEFKKRFDGLPIDHFRVLYPFAWPGQDTQDFVRPTGKKVFPCPVLWQSLSVGWDGKILGCCGDLNGMITLGDITKQGLRDIWNCEQMVWMRRQHVQKKHLDIPLCRDCDTVYVRVHPALRDLRDFVTGRWMPI